MSASDADPMVPGTDSSQSVHTDRGEELGTAPSPARPAAADDGAERREPIGPSEDEVRLVTAAGQGDREAFRALVESHQDFVLRVVGRMLRCRRELAEDLCQDVFLRAWRALPRFDGVVRFQTWIRKITVNLCITEIRKQRAQKRSSARTLSMDAPPPGAEASERSGIEAVEHRPGTDPGDRAHHREFADAVRAALADLPDEFRDAVVLRDLEGMAYEEIGEILGVAPGTVRSRIHRGRVQLQVLLQEYRP